MTAFLQGGSGNMYLAPRPVPDSVSGYNNSGVSSIPGIGEYVFHYPTDPSHPEDLTISRGTIDMAYHRRGLHGWFSWGAGFNVWPIESWVHMFVGGPSGYDDTGIPFPSAQQVPYQIYSGRTYSEVNGYLPPLDRKFYFDAWPGNPFDGGNINGPGWPHGDASLGFAVGEGIGLPLQALDPPEQEASEFSWWNQRGDARTIVSFAEVFRGASTDTTTDTEVSFVMAQDHTQDRYYPGPAGPDTWYMRRIGRHLFFKGASTGTGYYKGTVPAVDAQGRRMRPWHVEGLGTFGQGAVLFPDAKVTDPLYNAKALGGIGGFGLIRSTSGDFRKDGFAEDFPGYSTTSSAIYYWIESLATKGPVTLADLVPAPSVPSPKGKIQRAVSWPNGGPDLYARVADNPAASQYVIIGHLDSEREYPFDGVTYGASEYILDDNGQAIDWHPDPETYQRVPTTGNVFWVGNAQTVDFGGNYGPFVPVYVGRSDGNLFVPPFVAIGIIGEASTWPGPKLTNASAVRLSKSGISMVWGYDLRAVTWQSKAAFDSNVMHV